MEIIKEVIEAVSTNKVSQEQQQELQLYFETMS